jgi:hypothetical protein
MYILLYWSVILAVVCCKKKDEEPKEVPVDTPETVTFINDLEGPKMAGVGAIAIYISPDAQEQAYAAYHDVPTANGLSKRRIMVFSFSNNSGNSWKTIEVDEYINVKSLIPAGAAGRYYSLVQNRLHLIDINAGSVTQITNTMGWFEANYVTQFQGKIIINALPNPGYVAFEGTIQNYTPLTLPTGMLAVLPPPISTADNRLWAFSDDGIWVSSGLLQPFTQVSNVRLNASGPIGIVTNATFGEGHFLLQGHNSGRLGHYDTLSKSFQVIEVEGYSRDEVRWAQVHKGNIYALIRLNNNLKPTDKKVLILKKPLSGGLWETIYHNSTMNSTKDPVKVGEVLYFLGGNLIENAVQANLALWKFDLNANVLTCATINALQQIPYQVLSINTHKDGMLAGVGNFIWNYNKNSGQWQLTELAGNMAAQNKNGDVGVLHSNSKVAVQNYADNRIIEYGILTGHGGVNPANVCLRVLASNRFDNFYFNSKSTDVADQFPTRTLIFDPITGLFATPSPASHIVGFDAEGNASAIEYVFTRNAGENNYQRSFFSSLDGGSTFNSTQNLPYHGLTGKGQLFRTFTKKSSPEVSYYIEIANPKNTLSKTVKVNLVPSPRIEYQSAGIDLLNYSVVPMHERTYFLDSIHGLIFSTKDI